jgi:choline dehydrogenase
VARRGHDVVVVGGGSAGCVVAARLAEDPGCDVLLLEAGPTDRGVAAITAPARWTELLGGPLDWGHRYLPAERLDGRVIAAPRGRVLGGSGSINALLWHRGHPADYDRWAAAGAAGWSFAEVLPFFRRCESFGAGAPGWRGSDGPMRIGLPGDPHPLALAVLEAAAERGLPVLADHNGPAMEGAALANLAIGEGRRCSPATAYLHARPARPNLSIRTGALATGLSVAGRRCSGVEYVTGTVTAMAAADTVVLCAGAFETPRLLLLAGIGDPDELARLGLACRVALPGVGRNLQDHPLVKGINFAAARPLGAVRDQGGGAVLNWRSRPGLAVPDLHAFLVQGPHASPALRAGFPAEVFALSPGLMGSASRGTLRLTAARADAPLALDPNFLAEPADTAALLAAIDGILDLAEAPALRRWITRPLLPDRRLSGEAAKAFLRATLDTFFHPCGTCAMGTGPHAVVDPRLRVHGLDNLLVADASVMPTIPTGNIQAPVVMIAERAAAFLREAAHG